MKTMWHIFMILMRFISRMEFGKVRPQVFVAILCATFFSTFASWLAYQMNAVEIMTAIIAVSYTHLTLPTNREV